MEQNTYDNIIETHFTNGMYQIKKNHYDLLEEKNIKFEHKSVIF